MSRDHRAETLRVRILRLPEAARGELRTRIPVDSLHHPATSDAMFDRAEALVAAYEDRYRAKEPAE